MLWPRLWHPAVFKSSVSGILSCRLIFTEELSQKACVEVVFKTVGMALILCPSLCITWI